MLEAGVVSPVVDRAFQFKYTGMIVLTVVLISASLGYLLLLSYWEMNRIMDVALASFPGIGENCARNSCIIVLANTCIRKMLRHLFVRRRTDVQFIRSTTRKVLVFRSFNLWAYYLKLLVI